MSSFYQQLLEKQRRVCCLREVSELLSWDQETGMPDGAAPARADQLSVISELAHETTVSPEFGRLLDEAEKEGYAPESVEGHMLRKIRHDYDRAVKVPQALVAKLSAACSTCQSVWFKARQAKDFAMFKESLKAVIDLTRETAQYYGYQEHIYDALLEGYEPGARTAEISKVFKELRGGLVSLVKRIAAAQPVNLAVLQQSYPIKIQRQLCKRLMTDMGYDWNRGRTDDVVHPFCTSFSTLDVRVTNAFREQELSKALFGALHETGHAIYEQGSPAEFVHTPLEGGASMAIHESESRLWENIIGRSRAFWEHYYPVLQSYFPEQTATYSCDDFYRAINSVQPSFIRTEADEVTYSLHIMLRFELEKQLMEDKLSVDDLPEAWNAMMQEYLGITPRNDTEGCMQDVHWPMGLFGYFPAYALGNLIGAQTMESMRQDLPDLDKQLRAGNLTVIREWLHKHVYVWGQRLTPDEVIMKSTGRALSAQPFINYLENKYQAIYNL